MTRETEKERWERNFSDLLQELRVSQTGVQILFAFLLTLPFSAGFPDATPFQRDIYIVALLAAAAATALIISPVAFHRALFRQGRKPELVKYAHKVASAGLACMLVAMVAAVLLITDYVLPRGVAFLLSGLTGLWFVFFWLGLPWLRRDWGQDEDDADERRENYEPYELPRKTTDR
jgi:O-antigen/teichoic acid export membrane protein